MTESEPSAQWAIDLLTDRTYDETAFIEKYFIEVTTTLGGIGLSIFRNHIIRKAWSASLHHHAIGGLTGYVIGSLITIRLNRSWARRNAQLMDYIKLHPDRFPKPQYRPYKEVFNSWVPYR